MRTKELQILASMDKAVEIYATNPEITHKEVAEMIGVGFNTLKKFRRDPNFWSKVYDYYMTTFERDVVGVLKAAVREAMAGNVQAQRLVLEHSGKLQKNINITIDSPFEKWLKKSDDSMEVLNNVEDAEIVEDMPEFEELPPRTADNNHLNTYKERIKLQKLPAKAKSKANRNKLKREQYKWLKRAKAVGIDKLPAKRPTAGQKKAWQDKIIAAENQASQSNQE